MMEINVDKFKPIYTYITKRNIKHCTNNNNKKTKCVRVKSTPKHLINNTCIYNMNDKALILISH